MAPAVVARTPSTGCARLQLVATTSSPWTNARAPRRVQQRQRPAGGYFGSAPRWTPATDFPRESPPSRKYKSLDSVCVARPASITAGILCRRRDDLAGRLAAFSHIRLWTAAPRSLIEGFWSDRFGRLDVGFGPICGVGEKVALTSEGRFARVSVIFP